MKVHRALLGFGFATGLVMGGTLSTSASTGGSAPPDEAPGSTEPGELRRRARSGPATAVRWTCGSGRAATPRWSTPSSPPGTRCTPTARSRLTYIEHAEMVPQLARGIASGDVPDLMGIDLIYGPQFDGRRPARGHHRPDRRRPGARAHARGPPRRWRRTRIGSTACRCTPTSRCCSGTRTCSSRPASIPRSRRPTSRRSTTWRRRSTTPPTASTATTCRATAPGATSSPSPR